MVKKRNKAAITLLSGIIISGAVSTPLQINAMTDNIITVDQSLTRAIKTGVTTATSLNVRSGAGTSFSKIGSLSKGSTVQIEETTSNGWYKIKYGTTYGYISKDYVTITSNSDSNSNSSNNSSSATTVTHTGVVNATSLNVRSGASTSHSKIGTLKKGAKVEIVDRMSNGWAKIKYNSGFGYVSASYLSNIAPVTSSGSSSNNSSSATTVTHTGVVNATSLNVRSGASTSHSKIGTLKKGAKVEIVDRMSNGWAKIKYNSGFGYVSASYLSNITSITSSGGTSNDSSSNVTVIKTGIVSANSLNVRNGASTSSAKIGSLYRGTKVEVVNVESNGWYKIKYNGSFGYVSNEYIYVEGEGNVSGERKNLNNFLFVGDSFTVLLQNTIKAKNSNVYIHAKSGSRPSYWLDKVSSMPSNSSVDGVVLLIGVNGASTEANKTDTKALINKLSERYPNKTIYVQKVFPVGRAFTGANPATFNSKIASLNSVIQAHCNTVSNAKFIDTTSGFVDNSGYLIHHNGDGLHIDSKYNNQFYNNIFNAVKNAEK